MVGYDVDVSDFYSNGEFIKNPKGLNYVVLNGNFNDSVALAKSYFDDKNFGRYNFLFHNCADYTNTLLGVADIDGAASQILSDGNALIAIPALRELGFSVSNGIDSVTSWISDGLFNTGESMLGSNLLYNIAGGALMFAGKWIDMSSNFVADIIPIIDTKYSTYTQNVKILKDVLATTTNVIVDVGVAIKDGAVSLWNKLFG